MSLDRISIRGARQHNLKNINLEIPRDELVVITGLSGSGKSSLAFDTIYAEGQRRYVESLSAYARQFLGQMDKPDVDHIEGLSPAVSIDQKTTSKNPRSTVGTVTEIYDYLRLLFARVGIPHCPVCGRVIEKQTAEQIVDTLLELPEGTKFQVLAPIVKGRKGEYHKLFEDLKAEGFTRVRVDGEVRTLDEEIVLNKKLKHTIDVVLDRLVMKDSIRPRLAESVDMALKLAEGTVRVAVVDGEEHEYSQALACPEHGFSMDELNPRDFSFNAPYGACPECLGIGSRLEADPDLVVPDHTLTIAEGAIKPYSGNLNYYPQLVEAAAKHIGVSIDVPWGELPEEARHKLLHGFGDEKIRLDYLTRDGRETFWYTKYEGALASVMRRHEETDSELSKEKLEEYMAVIPCASCGGARLKPEILAVTVGGKNIHEVTGMSAGQSLRFFEAAELLTQREQIVASRIIKEIVERLRFLVDVGLDYLTLERATATLSGGEAQRIRLATQIGSGLVGVLYILDEPSIGLHQRDNERLIVALKRLRDIGNTVIVVEHDEETIREADHIIDVGPGAGEHGGHVVVAGTVDDVLACPESITGQYLSGRRQIPVRDVRRDPNHRRLVVRGAAEHNLKSLDVEFPLNVFICVTGVSGSGKSTLVNDILYRRLAAELHGARTRPGAHTGIEGLEHIDKVINVDQSPIGRTPRSNPATYTGLFTHIRELMARTPEARMRGYQPGRFSFNVRGGRCEACRGDGIIKIEMHFLPDVYVPCEVCHGKRYNRETLEVHYKGESIADILDMTVDEALDFFRNVPRIRRKLETMHDVGLGYIRLGQPATQLSGGEAQRVKLSTELSRRTNGRTLYILDEPTTGLHIADIHRLLEVLQRLVDAGDTVLVIEHNLEVIKSADWIVDLGPEGGQRGGNVVAVGPPEEIIKCGESHTARFLAPVLTAARQAK